MSDDFILPSADLTVVIRDDGPIINCGDSPSYRSVSIRLTREQLLALKRYHTHTCGSKKFYEQISKCWIEPLLNEEAMP